MKLNAKLPLPPLRAKKKVQNRPLDEYRARPDHLRAAGGAYLVLPYGVIAELAPELQQQLTSLLHTIQRQHPGWTASMVYQVLPWTRIRVEDLDETELAWHGITCDVDPTTATMTYTRGGSPVPAGTVLGHRPAIDTAPHAPGTLPGARPPLLPPTPDGPPTPGPPVLSPQLRSARVARLQITRERKHALAEFAPTIDPAWAKAITASDDLWESDEQWKQLAAQDTELPDRQSPAGPQPRIRPRLCRCPSRRRPGLPSRFRPPNLPQAPRLRWPRKQHQQPPRPTIRRSTGRPISPRSAPIWRTSSSSRTEEQQSGLRLSPVLVPPERRPEFVRLFGERRPILYRTRDGVGQTCQPVRR